MKRLATALKAFIVILTRKDVSINLKYGKKEVVFETGVFATTTQFLSTLQPRSNFPDYVLEQYKEVLTDFKYND